MISIEPLKPNWSFIGRHLGEFIKTWIIVAGLCYGAHYLLEAKHVQEFEARIKTQEARIESQKDLIEEYRERLGLVNPVRDRLAALSNAELKQHCLEHVSRFHRVLADAEARDRQASEAAFRAQG